MKHRKINSYIKCILIMIIGGIFGVALAIGSSVVNLVLHNTVRNLFTLIHDNAFIFLAFILLFVICTGFLCYRKGETIIRQTLASTDDDRQDILDREYDIWGTIGITASNTFLILAMMIYACAATEPIIQTSFLYTTGLLLLIAVSGSFYQIAFVRQNKRKDPSKFDDAMDLRFQKKFLASCDEAEKQIIYQSTYKSFQLMKYILMGSFIIALLFHVYSGNGILALTLIGIIYIIMLASYSIYTLKLQKEHINR